MCTNYVGVSDAARLERRFGVTLPVDYGVDKVWPTYRNVVVVNADRHEGGESLSRDAMRAMFGLVPHWATDINVGRKTYNARTETVAEKPSFRDAWRRAQHCIIPMEAFYEPDWRTGRAVPTHIASADGAPLGVAGIWAVNTRIQDEPFFSFTMLTVNADDHPLMNRFHRPGDEKRMVVILDPADYDGWLNASDQASWQFIKQFPAERLVAEGRPAEVRPQRSAPHLEPQEKPNVVKARKQPENPQEDSQRLLF